jgi:hypothetical protein
MNFTISGAVRLDHLVEQRRETRGAFAERGVLEGHCCMFRYRLRSLAVFGTIDTT